MDEHIIDAIEGMDTRGESIDQLLDREAWKQRNECVRFFDTLIVKTLHHSKQLYPVTVIKGDV